MPEDEQVEPCIPADVPSIKAMVPDLLVDVLTLLDVNPARHTKDIEKMTTLIQSWVKEKSTPQQMTLIDEEQ